MNISGLQKTSAIDYPGHLSAIVFTQGCNFKCPYCHNPSLIPMEDEQTEIELSNIFAFLDKRKGVLDAVSITGGEPTLQSDLVEFCSKVKDKGYKIKLDTNGTNPKMLEELINKGLVDYIAMDLKHPLNEYGWLTDGEYKNEMRKSIRLILNSGLNYEFRTTVIPSIHSPETIEKIVQEIPNAKHYYIQNFRPKVVYNDKFSEIRRFTEEELGKMQEIAQDYVSEVAVRN